MLLTDPVQYAGAKASLVALEPRFAPVVQAHLTERYPQRETGFQGLVRAIAFQQISVAAGATIWGRVEALVGAMNAQSVLKHDVEALKACGLSRPKARYVHAIAEAEVSGALDFDRIETASDADARAELVAVKGVGPWTADIYLMFGLGRPDILPAADLGLQEGYRRLFGEEARPDADRLSGASEAWRPVRTVAALALWAYLNAEQGRQSGGV